MPLILDAHGNKFGKSEGNAVWIDKNKTSPYKLYQFLINSDDSMVISYLKKLTFLTREEIERIEEEQNKAPHLRIAQKTLAFEVVKDIHGIVEAENAKKASEEMFANGGISSDIPKVKISKSEFENGIMILDLLVKANLCESRSEAKRLVLGGGVSFNRKKISEVGKIIYLSDLEKSGNVLQKGKKNFVGIEIE